MKGLNATKKMREWDKRKKSARKYQNSNSTAYVGDRKKRNKKRLQERKDAHERYLTARYQQELKDKGRVFIPEFDTHQADLHTLLVVKDERDTG